MTKNEFVSALVTEVRKAKLPDYVKQTPADIAAQLEENAKVFVSGELTEEATTCGGSKVGGKPDVEANFEWPCEEDSESPLQFIAQINLAEVSPHDFERRLPSAGMLWFFSIADGDRAYGHEINASTTSVRFSPKPGVLTPRDIPEELADNEDATVEERKLEFGATVSLNDFRDSGIKDVIREAMRALGGRSGPLFMLNEHGSDDEVEGSVAGFMLADFDGYAIAQNAFGEGCLSFVLSPSDLAAGKLANAETVFEVGT